MATLPASAVTELVITDWHSVDWPIKDWIDESADKLDVQVIQLDGPFNRGRGRNEAARAAKGDVLLFLDADSLICPELLTRGLRCVQDGSAYFPILFSYDNPEHTSGYWRRFGYGNCMINRQAFRKAGGWPERNS